MGDYGRGTAALAYANTFIDYKDHCSAKTINTELAVKEAIRAAHPSAIIDIISLRACDLFGFAQAGHATATVTVEGDNILAERSYEPPPNRLQGGHGTLGLKVKFGHYNLEWQGERWEFYVAQWREKYDRIKMCYLVSPRDREANKIDQLLLAASKWTSELHKEIYVFDDGDWEKNKKLWEAVQSSSWDDVILDPTMKDTLISDVQNFFDSRALYEEYAVPWKRGIILHGKPGCGKTISIKVSRDSILLLRSSQRLKDRTNAWLIGICEALMNSLDKRDTPVASLYVKTLATCRGLHYSVREIFAQARTMAPCLLVFEDLDSLVVDKIRSYFLNEVDGLEDNNGILMIGSTNHLERLDPGISKRPSRFDRKYHFKIPGERERILYCEYWKKKLEKNSNLDFDPAISEVVAKLTDGFSFAYLKELFVQTLLTIVGGRESELEDDEELNKIANDSKVVEGSAKVAVGDEKVSSVEGEDTANTDEVERKAPAVTIPDKLKENALMRVLHKQALALWKDMDNTGDEEAGVKKVPSKADDDEDDDDDDDEGMDDYQMQLMLLKQQNKK